MGVPQQCLKGECREATGAREVIKGKSGFALTIWNSIAPTGPQFFHQVLGRSRIFGWGFWGNSVYQDTYDYFRIVVWPYSRICASLLVPPTSTILSPFQWGKRFFLPLLKLFEISVITETTAEISRENGRVGKVMGNHLGPNFLAHISTCLTGKGFPQPYSK